MLKVGAADTVMVISAVWPLPSAAVARMVTVPALTPVTTPEALTVAMAELRLLHVTDPFVASAGVTLTVSVTVLPASTDTGEADCVIVMPETFTMVSAGTFSEQEKNAVIKTAAIVRKKCLFICCLFLCELLIVKLTVCYLCFLSKDTKKTCKPFNIGLHVL
jgi:hypothetical protein